VIARLTAGTPSEYGMTAGDQHVEAMLVAAVSLLS
jgi:hypothetical protein